MSNKTSQCEKCGRRVRTLTIAGLCYGCHIEKFGVVPETGQYKQESAKK